MASGRRQSAATVTARGLRESEGGAETQAGRDECELSVYIRQSDRGLRDDDERSWSGALAEAAGVVDRTAAVMRSGSGPAQSGIWATRLDEPAVFLQVGRTISIRHDTVKLLET